ncbi:MAG: hypothetical protein KGZ46_12250 [Hydrogenophaga sp.]|nr:hypothetical protein [Hydrogenophaga sp.]
MTTKKSKAERDPDLRQALADHSFVYLKECALRFASPDLATHEDGRARIEAVCRLIGDHLDLQLWNQTLASINKENAALPRSKRVDHDTIEHEYRRLLREGFTPRQARGKLVANGVGTQPTIYRITKSIQ